MSAATFASNLVESLKSIIFIFAQLILQAIDKRKRSTMTLCKDCEEFLQILHEEVPAMGFTRPLEVIEAAADAGCNACAIYGAIYHHFVEAGIIPRGSVVPVFVSAVAFFSRPNMLAGIPDYEGPCMPFLLRPAEEVENLLRSSSVEGNSTNSDESFACAKEWLRVCTTSHTSCRPIQQDGSYRPTRLLHISASGTEVRLCEGDEMPARLTYATLSHSWGSVLPLTLTGARLPSFKKGIPLTDLPKTFQEAVQVAQRFSIDYIWIDCLCIIQDSAEDWKQESVLMASIYGNSHLNIAATASRDGRGGCFRPRRATALHPVKMTIHSKDFYLVDAEMWWEAFEKAPLNTRAWVLQERLLSPRVLHYDHDQLVWECNELTASERYPEGIRGKLIPAPRFLRNRLDDLVGQTTLLPGQELFHAWKPIVRAYSSCGLTKYSDKLIALHGVASRIKQALKANYGAGLFSTNLESQLLWKVMDNEKSTRPEQAVAPSWSWASLIAPVSVLPQWDFLDTRGEEFTRQFKPEEIKEKIFCRVRNKHLFGTKDTTSMVSHEKLEVEGYLVPMHYVALSETADWKETKYKPKQEYDQDESTLPTEIWPMAMRSWHWMVDEGETWDAVEYDGGSELSVLVTAKKGEETESFKIWLEHDIRSEAFTKEERWLLPVYSVTEWQGVDVFELKRYRSLNGLLLERVDSEKAVFRRCGSFKLKAELNENGPWRFWNSALRFDALQGTVEPETCDDVVVPVISATQPAEDASEEEKSIRYEQRDGAKQYVVTIV